MRLVAKNFRAYSFFDITFIAATNNLVLGDSAGSSDYADTNSSGKSSIMYAVLWALYGKWPDMESANSCINVTASKEDPCEVYFEFKDTEGRPCSVTRSRRPNSVEFWCGTNRTTGDLKIVQAVIDAAMGCDYDFYVKVFVYTGGEDTKFSRLTDGKQKAILDTILPMDFSAAMGFAADMQKKADDKMDEQDSLIHVGMQDAYKLSKDIEAAKIQSAAFEAQRGKDRKPLEDAIIRLDGEYALALRHQSGSIEMEKFARVNLDKAQADYTRESERSRQYEQQFLELGRRAAAILEKIKRNAFAIEGLENEQLRDCPTCAQPLGDPVAKANAIAKFRKEGGALSDERTLITVLQSALNEHIPSDASYALSTLETYKSSHNMTVADLERDRTSIHRTEATLKDAHTALSLRLPAGTPNSHQVQVEIYEKQYKQKVADYTEAQEQKGVHRQDVYLWQHVLDALGNRGIKHYAFETLCPEMTAIAQTFMHHLSPDQLTLRFRSHKAVGKKIKEGFHIDVSRKIGNAVKEGYGDMSGGEKSRIDLVVFLTLFLMAQRHVNNMGLLFLDEVADTLDTAGKATVVDLLDFFTAEYGVTALILTNDERIASYITRGYRCRLNNGRGEVHLLSED